MRTVRPDCHSGVQIDLLDIALVQYRIINRQTLTTPLDLTNGCAPEETRIANE